jgi:streptomycin 6-kinase
MVWWNAKGAARVLAHAEDVILMECAERGPSLAYNARNGADDETSRAMWAVLAQLHAPRDPPSSALIPLTEWFDALGPAAEIHDGILRVAAVGQCIAGSRLKLIDAPGRSRESPWVAGRTVRGGIRQRE